MSHIKNQPPEKSSTHEDTKYKAQLEIVYKALLKQPMTMKEVDVATGIMRENICRHVRCLRLRNQVAVLRKRYCKITKHLAGELTTDESLFPKVPKQLKLF